MYSIRCHVRINGTRSGPGVPQQSRAHHGTHRSAEGCHRIWGVEGGIWTDTGGAEDGGTILTSHPRGTDGMRPPTINRRSTTTDYRPTGEAVPAPAVQLHPVGAADTVTDEQMGQSQEVTCSTRNGKRASTRIHGHDPRCTAIPRGSPQVEDAFSERLHIGSQGCSGCSPVPGRQRPEFSRLHRLCRVGSNSVERLDCSTPDGHTTKARHLSQQTVKDAVHIQLAERSCLRTHFATRSGERNDRAGRPTSFYTTPASSCWGLRLSSHRQTENAGD